MPKAEKLTKAQVRQRFLLALQSKGSLGKSTLAGLTTEFCLHNQIPFDAIDCDPGHHTLLDRYPDHAIPFKLTERRDDFGQLLNPLPAAPVVLWDFRSNYTQNFIDHDGYYAIADALAEAGARMTMFLFESDNTNAQDSAAALFEHFGEAIDWVLVANPGAVPKHAEFRQIGLYQALMDRKTPVLDLPQISTVSLNAWSALEAKEQRFLSLGSVIKHPELPFVARRELSKVLDRVFVQFEDLGTLLVPDEALIKNRCTRVQSSKPTAPMNRFQNPLLARK
jgi:hypothetical protein